MACPNPSTALAKEAALNRALKLSRLVTLYFLPLIFTPNLVYNLHDDPRWLIYVLNSINGFVLISLYNLQDALEDPFDQMGLDDIKLDEFEFLEPGPRDHYAQ